MSQSPVKPMSEMTDAELAALARQVAARIDDGATRDEYQRGYAEGVKAALAECREEARSLVAGFARVVAEQVVDEAERALSVTPREAEEGKET